ncbi:MAG: cysteine--tRNA ligase [Patescibacteria group bacterium]
MKKTTSIKMIKLYNSLSKEKQDFEPITTGLVRMYNCGPTVYDYVHVGNLRSYVSADIFRRVFEYNGYSVRQVINITDVGHLTGDTDEGEDKMERRAQERNKTAKELAEFYTDAFFKDIYSLNIKTEETIFPRATEYIKEQIELIKDLEDKGFTYRTSDGIYFNTSKLSKYDVFGVAGDSLIQGARVEVNSEKMHPTDFALWKFSPLQGKRQQEWDSPWGVGFPGWHLECSAMSIKLLGEQFDVHTGGIDHKFPHHPNEIAQAESATGKKPFVRYWLHNEFLSFEGSKMAKSEGNFLTLNDVVSKGFDPMVYRYWLLGAHYRKPISFSWEALQGASNAYKKLLKYAEDIYTEEFEAEPESEYIGLMSEYLNDDFDTPSALALLWKLVKDKNIKDDIKHATLREFDFVLGLALMSNIQMEKDIPSEVKDLLEKRKKARERKNWKESDRLRDEIEKHGFTVKDTPQGAKIVS